MAITYIEHPITSIKKTTNAWAKQYSVPRSSLWLWFKTIPEEKVFKELDAGGRPVATSSPSVKWMNPITEEIHTIQEWAEKLDYSPRYLRLKIKNGEIPFVRVEGSATPKIDTPPIALVQLAVSIAKKNNAILCTNSKMEVSLPACEWAKFYGVPVSEFWQAMRRYGKDSPKLYQHFEQRKSA